ncbi:hypothetical protein VPHD528_0061 [Vibrio phage D528]
MLSICVFRFKMRATILHPTSLNKYVSMNTAS